MLIRHPISARQPLAPTKARVLIADDDALTGEAMCEFLGSEGYRVERAAGLSAAVRAMDREPADVILCDANIPGGSGFELLHVARRRWPETVLIMMTSYGTIESAVEAIKLGAYDYLTKPIVDDELKVCISRAVAQQLLLRENRVLKDNLRHHFGLASVVGHDYRMLKIFEVVQSVAPSKISVLIQGDSGTGKSLLARVMHQLSDRCEAPFIEMSCGALPETLLESELFGHSRGSFTGAVADKIGRFKAAHGGTIFLDEISAASPALQLKLLRVLQTHQFEPVGSNKTEAVDVRVILATNANLEKEVKTGRFREDLFYRVNVVSIDMPTLWERIGDIPLLARHFLKKACSEFDLRVNDFDDDAMRAMQSYRWPGNVRELENVIQRAVVLCGKLRISIEDLPPRVAAACASRAFDPTLSPAESTTGGAVTLDEALAAAEKSILQGALAANHFNRQGTASQLGINRTTLYKKMKRHGLS